MVRDHVTHECSTQIHPSAWQIVYIHIHVPTNIIEYISTNQLVLITQILPITFSTSLAADWLIIYRKDFCFSDELGLSKPHRTWSMKQMNWTLKLFFICCLVLRCWTNPINKTSYKLPYYIILFQCPIWLVEFSILNTHMYSYFYVIVLSCVLSLFEKKKKICKRKQPSPTRVAYTHPPHYHLCSHPQMEVIINHDP